MAKDRGGSSHFFAALLVTCGILSFGLLEWRLSKTLSHHPTRHEGDGPWLKPRVYHRRKDDAVGSAPAAAEAAAARAARAADRAYAASLTAKDAADRSERKSLKRTRPSRRTSPSSRRRTSVWWSRTRQKRGTRCATGPRRSPLATPSC